MKKLSSLFLLALLPLMASTQTLINGIYYYFDASTNTAMVTSGSSKYTGSVTIPETITYNGVTSSVKYIDDLAFEDCSDLTSVTISSSISYIGRSVFRNCPSLISIIVDSGNTIYDSRNDCNAIIATSTNTLIGGCKNTIIPNGVTSIGNSAFYDCSGLPFVTIPNSVTSIGEKSFENCSGLKTITIGNSVTSIGDGAFRGCSGLTSVTIPNSVTSIGSSAFRDCVGLTSVEIPNSVTEMGVKTFQGCTRLTSVTIGNSVTSIGRRVFSDCSALTSVTLPNSVTEIGTSAFQDCSSLTSVICKATSVPSTSYDAFYNVPQSSATLYVPASALDDYKTTSPWSGFGTIEAIPGGGLRGDVNGDGEVNVGDLVSVSNYMAGDDSVSKDAADVNQDGEVNVGDMVVISNIMSGNE